MTAGKHCCIVCRSEQSLSFTYKGYKYYRCPKCFLVSTYPLPTSKQIEEHYKQKYKKGNYSLLEKFSKEYNSIYSGFAKEIEKYVTFDNKHGKLLDVGCFTGEFLEVIRGRGYEAYGVELQKEAASIANKKFPKKIYSGDVKNLGNKFGKFDIITMNGLIEHVTDPVKMFSEMDLLLKPGGTVFIQTPDSGSLIARIMSKYWPPYQPVEHIHLFSGRSLKFLLNKMGYKNIVIKRHVKKLPVNYVYQNLQNFGDELYKILKPLSKLINKLDFTFPFYIGEIVVLSKKE